VSFYVRINRMKKNAKRVITAVCGLMLFGLILHLLLTTWDSVRVTRLTERIRSLKRGDPLDTVVDVMGKPDSQGKHTVDIKTGVEYGPCLVYHRKRKWSDPLYPLRIHQGWYEGVNISIYFDTNSLVREIQISEN
jgi:hypothetical protein